MTNKPSIIPTVGRIIWFFANRGAKEQAAIVTYVHDDQTIDVCIFPPGGTPSPMTRVHLVAEGDGVPAGGPYCAWMPYQVGQAKAAATTEAPAAA